ncbi:MAG: DUF1318 domain-containing protein [Thermodesulfobacteriota bacterium]
MKKRVAVLTGMLFFAVVSCMVITVNIYFPEKEVEEAFKILEKELMTPEGEKQEHKPDAKPESSIKFELVTSAYAQELGLSEKIAEMVKKMPDVVNAYKEMGARIADIDKLRDNGAVGIGNSGMLVFRDEELLTPDQKKLVSAENENRKTIINGMAKAIIRINRAPENEQNLKQVMPQAVKRFAAIRQEMAKKGWWIQSSDGNWSRK